MKLAPKSKDETLKDGYLVTFTDKDVSGEVLLDREMFSSLDRAVDMIRYTLSSSDAEKITIEPCKFCGVQR